MKATTSERRALEKAINRIPREGSADAVILARGCAMACHEKPRI